MDETDISGDLVSYGNLHDVSGNDITGTDLLDAVLVRSDNFSHFRFIFLESFDGVLGIALLKR